MEEILVTNFSFLKNFAIVYFFTCVACFSASTCRGKKRKRRCLLCRGPVALFRCWRWSCPSSGLGRGRVGVFLQTRGAVCLEAHVIEKLIPACPEDVCNVHVPSEEQHVAQECSLLSRRTNNPPVAAAQTLQTTRISPFCFCTVWLNRTRWFCGLCSLIPTIRICLSFSNTGTWELLCLGLAGLCLPESIKHSSD